MDQSESNKSETKTSVTDDIHEMKSIQGKPQNVIPQKIKTSQKKFIFSLAIFVGLLLTVTFLCKYLK